MVETVGRYPRKKLEFAKKPKKKTPTSFKDDPDFLKLLRDTVEKTKITRPPTVVKSDLPTAGKGRTGPKRPDGSGGASKDQ